MRIKSLAFAISAALMMTTGSAYAQQHYQKETEAYKQFVIEQIDQLEASTQKFVAALKSGDVQEAKKIYPLARMYYERSEPIAESFGDLDPRIDARLADLQEEAKSENKNADEKAIENGWTGFHKIEKILWTENTTKGTEAVADQLLKDVKELRAKIPTTEVTAELMVTGAVDLLNEVSTSKITGEEDIFSKTDLYDFKANIEGAEKIFELLKPAIDKKDSKLAKDIEKKFAAVNTLLAKYNQDQAGYAYVGYDKLTSADTKALAEAVNKLGEPLSQMGIILGK